jgi:predicted  nucleic acid-binding Zn-ribbon protein
MPKKEITICEKCGKVFNQEVNWDESFEKLCPECYANKELKLQELQENKKEFREILDTAFMLFEERNEKYGNSWEVLTIQSTANLIEMKMNRIATLGIETKTEDEFIDTINYAVMGILKLKKMQ